MMQRFKITLAASLALLPLVAGCGGGGTPPVVLPPTADLVVTSGGRKVDQPNWTVDINPDVQPKKKWTVLVYMNGANDLETYGILNMNQMEQIGSTEGVNLVTQYKRYAGRYDSSNGDWGDTRRFYVTRDNDTDLIQSNLIAQRDNLDMGNPQTLKDFIRWGMETFPADHFVLVLWNHGAGWRSRAVGGQVTRGVSYDDITGHHIDTVQMPDALARIDGQKWDTLLVDCSLMQMAEVAYEIRGVSDFIVGSEESPPGEGFPYDLFIRRLAQNPDMSARDFSQHVIDDTLVRYGASSNSTQSVLEASKVGAYASALNNLGAALTAAQPTWGEAISDARSDSESYAYSENKDLIDFLDRLKDNVGGNPRVNDAGVQAAADAVRSALNASLVGNIAGSQHARSHGVAAFLPTPTRFRSIDVEQANGFGQRYQALALAKDAPNWLNFLANGPR